MDRQIDFKRATEADEMDLKGKKVIALGERDGVHGSSIVQCVESAGAEVVIEFTSCFV